MAVLISHRFSTVRMADRILVLDGGLILEQGSHEQLTRLGGRYAELFRAAGRRVSVEPRGKAGSGATQPLRDAGWAGDRADARRRDTHPGKRTRPPWGRMMTAKQDASRRPGMGWRQLWRSLGETRELAHANPRLTGFMRYRACEPGRVCEPDLGSWVALDDISPYLVCAVVRAEDRGFFRHRGFWWSNVWVEIRAARREKRGVRGVSTITQQLARNLYLHPERSMKRKLHEAILAWRLERVLTKERILELYLNLIEWGDGIWGVEAAARTYFSRTPAEIDPLQAVVLASLIPAPRRPLLDLNAKRALLAQKRMAVHLYGCGLLSREELHQTRAKIQYLGQAIGDGVPAPELFRRTAELAIEPTLSDRPHISTRALIADDCRLDRCESLLSITRSAGPELADRLPLWWTGEPEPALLTAESPRAIHA
jgi:monofunctional biosynthetic peptidoglycan transglycosylase